MIAFINENLSIAKLAMVSSFERKFNCECFHSLNREYIDSDFAQVDRRNRRSWSDNRRDNWWSIQTHIFIARPIYVKKLQII